MTNFDESPSGLHPPRQPDPIHSRPEKGPLEFQMSDQTDKLVAALVKAQGEIETASKDANNPHFDKTYADLASVWKACRQALSSAGVLVIQWPIPASAANRVALVTRVAHGDQWMQSGLEMPVSKPDAHGVGSALTYLRRYMLQTVTGVAPEGDDDDGNTATGRQPAVAPVAPSPAKGPSAAMITRLWTIAGASKWSNEQVHLYIKARWNLDSVKGLLDNQYGELCEAVMPTKTYEQACVGLVGVSGGQR